MIDLEAFTYESAKPKEQGYYAAYNRFDIKKRKLIVEWDGKRVRCCQSNFSSGENYLFGPKVAERVHDDLDEYEREMGLTGSIG